MSAALQMLTPATCRRCATPFEFLGNVTPDLCSSCLFDDQVYEARYPKHRCAACGDLFRRLDLEEFCAQCIHLEGADLSTHPATCRCRDHRYPDSAEVREPEDA